MPKKIKVRIRGKQSTSSGHLITSRQDSGRYFVLISVIFLFMMTMMSVYAVCQAPASPGFWSVFVFFFGLLAFILLYEENVFPKIDREKIVYFISTWILAWLIIVPYFIISAVQFNFGIFILVLVFLAILTPLVVRLILTQTQ